MIPVSIKVEGFVAPRPGSQSARETRTTYWCDSVYLRKHTLIEISAPSAKLTEDLWIDARPPLKVSLAFALGQTPTIKLYLVAALALSMLASGIAGVAAYRGQVPNFWRFALFGAVNVLTFTGLSFLAIGPRVDVRFVRGRASAPPPLVGTEVLGKKVLLACHGAHASARRGGVLILRDLATMLWVLMLWPAAALQIGPFMWAKARDRGLFSYLALFLVLFLAFDGRAWACFRLALR